MQSLAVRVKRARALLGLSQGDLARRLGVQRSAVAQWESTPGTTPSMKHLVALSKLCGVQLEWLGTGRGRMLPGDGDWDAPVHGDYAQDDFESAMLRAVRRLPERLRVKLLELVEELARGRGRG